MTRSFAFRIAVLSALISAAVLIAFGVVALVRVNAVNIQRIDNEISFRALRHLSGRGGGWLRWERLEQALTQAYGEEGYILAAIGRGGDVVYRSASWPDELSVDQFPRPGPGMPVLRRPFTIYRRGQRWQFRSAADGTRREGRSGDEGRGLRKGRPDAEGGAESEEADRAGGPDSERRKGPGGRPPWVERPPAGEDTSADERAAREKQSSAPAQPRGQGRDSPGGRPPWAEGTPAGERPGYGDATVRRGRGGGGARGGNPPRVLRRPKFVTRQIGEGTWRIGITGTDEVTLVSGVSLADHYRHMRRIILAFLTVLPLPLALIALGAWVVSRRALRPIDRLTRTAESITATGLDQRIREGQEDVEFARLISVFNEMMDRLERSFQQATRFSADAAHELKTPLAILQGELEQALQSAEEDSRQQRVLGDLLEEVQRLKSITQKLLLLSRADAGSLNIKRQPVNLTEMTEMMYDDAEVLAPELTIKKHLAEDVIVDADEDLLRQILQNLLSNAVKYNRDDGTIELELSTSDSEAILTVANTGPQIPPEDQDRIFDRFYRVDKSRGRRTDGIGLGLSLSQEIARAHDGDLALTEAREDMTTFMLRLPLTDTPD